MHIPALTPAYFAQMALGREDITWYTPDQPPFAIHGLTKTGENTWRRMPEEVADATSESVARLNRCTAGGRIRFSTNSPFVAVRAKPLNEGGMDHMAMTGIAGCDIYCGTTFAGTIRPKNMTGQIYETLIKLPEGEQQITIDLPLYNGLSAIAIGLQTGSSLSEGAPYANAKPVVFYGSSITQGGCASRPGTCYQAHLSRWLDMDYVNLGFSGSGKAEDAVVEYIASLAMEVFVMDYDHNAPTAQYLEMTHERFFKAVREKQPELPILILSRPDVDRDPADAAARFAAVRRTYENALAAGDKNVRLINGEEFFAGPDRRECTVDGCHPTDLGFYRMACVIRPVLAQLLGRES
ncbi:MAG: SGNH/GDSL hydrolase family protein [Eubacteriales bacterium]|nr:SGNH/GDSL hydrolase family protein [Eubacteriales bacterium]